MKKRRYVRIRFEKPAEFSPRGTDFRVIDLKYGHDLAAWIPLSYVAAFWNARPGDRVQATIFRRHATTGQKYVQRRQRRREIARRHVVFKFAEIVQREAAA